MVSLNKKQRNQRLLWKSTALDGFQSTELNWSRCFQMESIKRNYRFWFYNYSPLVSRVSEWLLAPGLQQLWTMSENYAPLGPPILNNHELTVYNSKEVYFKLYIPHAGFVDPQLLWVELFEAYNQPTWKNSGNRLNGNCQLSFLLPLFHRYEILFFSSSKGCCPPFSS